MNTSVIIPQHYELGHTLTHIMTQTLTYGVQFEVCIFRHYEAHYPH